MAFKNTDVNNNDWKKRKEEARQAFSQDQVKKSASFYQATGAKRNGTDNSSKIKTTTSSIKAHKKYLDNTKYSFSNKKVEDMNLSEVIAMANVNGAFSSYQPYLEKQVLDPTSRFYNPYFGKRVVNSAGAQFLREYFNYDGEFDEAFFEATKDWAQYEIHDGNTSLNIQSPGSKGTPEQWAAYYRIQLQNDMKTQYEVDEEWKELRRNLSEEYKSLEYIYGRKPTYDEFIARLDMSKYSSLKDIDDSRNLDYGTSHAVVELNKGTWYSQESIAGLYYALSNGGDISEDRDYFGDAVSFYMQAVEAPLKKKNALESLGYKNTESWSDKEYESAMREARRNGDHVAYETLKAIQWYNSDHMGSLEVTDYLGERFGYYKDDAYFKSIEEVFAPIWEEMYTDVSKSGVKKPANSDSLVYHAAYQAWQDMELKENTELVEQQAKAVYDAIDSLDKADFASEEEYAEFVREHILDLSGDAKSELRRYMDGSLKTARDIFISDEELEQYIHEKWSGASPAPRIETVVMEPDEEPPFYSYEQQQKAIQAATDRRADADEIGRALVALAESGNPVSASQIVEHGLVVAGQSILENPLAAETLTALWTSLRADTLREKLGENATFEQMKAADPVLKMISEATGSGDGSIVTLNGIDELLTMQTISQMNGTSKTVADGAIQVAIADPENLISAMGELRSGGNYAAFNAEFDIRSYNDVYNRCKEAGYSGEKAVRIALDSTVYCIPGLKAIGLGLEGDAELSGAVQSMTEKITSAEGYVDSAAVVGSIAGDVSAAAGEDQAEDIREFSSDLVLGMSECAPPAHSASTRSLLSDILRGDISVEDIVDGLKNSAKSLARAAAGAYGEQLKSFGYSSPIITTERYDSLDDEARKTADLQYNQGISDDTSTGEILNGIVAYATKNGNGEKRDISKLQNTLSDSDFISWLGTVTNLSSEEDQELYKVKNDLRTYGKWFTYDEGYALANAWMSGYIDYDGFCEILENRVSKYSGAYLNAKNHPDLLTEGAQIAYFALDDTNAAIEHNLEVAKSGISDDVVRSAESAMKYIQSAADPVTSVRSNEGLGEAINLDGLIAQHGDDEAALAIAIDDALRDLVERGSEHNVVDMTSGYDFTLDQVDELRKFVEIYEDFGPYGYDLVTSVAPADLKKFGVDFEKVGLKGSLVDYMDELTKGEWRAAYEADGIGLVSTLTTGLTMGYQGVGNVVAGGSRLIRDVVSLIPGIDISYEEGDGSYYDRVQGVSGKVSERLSVKGRGYEQFFANVVSEVARNQITGALGAALGKLGNSAAFAGDVAKIVKGGKAVNVSGAIQLADMAFKADKVIDATTILSRVPFASGVLTGSYAENRDKGKGVLLSIARAGVDTAVELFTETPAVDAKLNAAKSILLPGLNKMNNGVLGYIAGTASDIFNEVGQEEISMMFGRIFDFGEKMFDSDIAHFGARFYSALANASEGLGEDALETAFTTTCITLLGGIFNLPQEALSRRMLRDYQTGGKRMSLDDLEAILDVAVAELAETTASEEAETTSDPVRDAVKAALKDEATEEEVAAVIEEAMDYDPFETVNTSEEEEPLIQKDDPDAEEVQDPVPERDPNLSVGATKVADYMDSSEEQVGEAVATEVGNRVYEEAMANDTQIKSAEKNVEVAEENLARQQQKVESIGRKIRQLNARLQGIFRAAANENQPFNSPNVQNSIVANQQETTALQNDLTKEQEKVDELQLAVDRSNKELEEIKADVEKLLRGQRETAINKARVSIEEARKILREENAARLPEGKTVHGYGQDLKGTHVDKLSKEEFEERELTADYVHMEDAADPESQNNKHHREGTDIDVEEDSSRDPTSYVEQFANLTMSLGELFNHLADISESNRRLLMQNVTRKEYDALYGIFKRIPGAEAYISSFFKREKNSDSNADLRVVGNNNTLTVDKVKERTDADYRTLLADFGLTVRGETENHIFFTTPARTGGYDRAHNVQANASDESIENKSESVVAAEAKLHLSIRTKSDLEYQQEQLRLIRIEAKKKNDEATFKTALEEGKKVAEAIEKAKADVAMARSELNQIKQREKGMYATRYIAFNKERSREHLAKIRRYATMIKEQSASQRSEYAEKIRTGKITTQELIDEYLKLTDVENLSKQEADLVYENVSKMSNAKLLEELCLAWTDKANEEMSQYVYGLPQFLQFRTESEMELFVEEDGGWKKNDNGEVVGNYDVDRSYYVSIPLLSLLRQYERQLASSNTDQNSFGRAISALNAVDKEDFIAKVITAIRKDSYTNSESNSIDRVVGVLTNSKKSPITPDKRYSAVDTSSLGTLRVAAGKSNSWLQNKNGSYSVDRANDIVKRAFESIEVGNVDDGNYEVYVVREIDGKMVVRKFGAYYRDIDGVYSPSYGSVVECEAEVYVRFAYSMFSDVKKTDIDFSIKYQKQDSTDTIRSNCENAKRAFTGLGDGDAPSADQYILYLESYLKARREVIERDLNRIARGFRLNGNALGDERIKQLAVDVKNLREELTQISDILQKSEALKQYAADDVLDGPVLSKGDLFDGVQNAIENTGADSPESQAALAVYEAAPEAADNAETPDTASTRAKREAAAEVDQTLTQDMDAEERGSYYAERANDAAADGDEYRHNQYQNRVLEAAEEMGWLDGVEPATEEVPEADGMEDMNDGDVVRKAIEEYQITPEAEVILDENYPDRNAVDENDQNDEEDQTTETSSEYVIDENTLMGEYDGSSDYVMRGMNVLREQEKLRANLQGQIDGLASELAVLKTAGAERYKKMADARDELQKEREKHKRNSPEYASLNASINSLTMDMKADTEGAAAYNPWYEKRSEKIELEKRRNAAKANMRANSRAVLGANVVKGYAEGKAKYNPSAPIPGTIGNKTGTDIAKEILRDAKDQGLLRYGRRTALTPRHVAELLKPKFSDEFYKDVTKDAKLFTKLRREVEKEHADDIFRLSIIEEKVELGKNETAEARLIEAYTEGIHRSDYSRDGYNDYVKAVSDARNEALERAKKLREEYKEGKSKHALLEEHASLTKKIAKDDDILSNMRSVERATYRLGTGDIEGALNGDYGGQIPAPLMNVFVGMIAEADGKSLGKISSMLDNHERNVISLLGEYAPFFNAVFIIPAQRANDEQKANTTERLKQLEKDIPNVEIDITTESDGEPVASKMNLREIVGHIIDERTHKEFKDISDSDYVDERIRMYGITDPVLKRQVRDAVRAAQILNDDLYIKANNALVKNGHFEQAYRYRKWYMHHYKNDDPKNVGERVLKFFGINYGDNEINPALGDTEDTRPSHQFNAASLERHGEETEYDFVESVRRSLHAVQNTIYQTSNVDRLKQLEQAINGNVLRDENGNVIHKDNKPVYEDRPLFVIGPNGEEINKGYLTDLGNLFGEYSQRAANKRTASVDRALFDKKLGRKGLAYLNLATSLRSLNAVAFNPLSAATNIAPLKFLVGIVSAEDFTSAIASTSAQMSGKAKPDFVATYSNFVKGRTEHSAEERAIQGKVIDAGYWMSAAADRFTTNVMVRALFNHELRILGDKDAALVQAEDMARAMLADKSRVGRSWFYENQSLGGLLGQFQQESVNEFMYMLKDMKYYGGGKVPKALAMMLGVFVFNAIFNLLRGSGAMPDPIGAVVETYNEHQNSAEDKTVARKAVDYVQSVAGALNPVDFIGTGSTAVGGAGEDIAEYLDRLIDGEEDIWGFFSVLGSTFFPGGTTLRRAVTGVKSVSQGYAESSKGNVKHDINPSWWKYPVAAISGTNALPDAWGYNYWTETSLSAKESKNFKRLVKNGMKPSEAWKAIKGNNDASALSKAAVDANSDADASAKEVVDSERAAQKSRSTAGIPSNAAAWAMEGYNSGDENDPVNVGISLWTKYGLETYPRAYEDERADDEYRKVFKMQVGMYLNGVYGNVGSKDAAEGLENALRKARTKINKKYSTDEEDKEGGDLNG